MIVIGASRNGPDAGDGLNGTSILLKLARGLSKMLHNKTHYWIPRRTIRLVSWGGADVNDMGMVEFLEVSYLIHRFVINILLSTLLCY